MVLSMATSCYDANFIHPVNTKFKICCFIKPVLGFMFIASFQFATVDGF